MTRRRDRINGEWNTPDKPFTWEHATIEVLMDIRAELRTLNATLGCYRVSRMSDDINRIDKRLHNAGMLAIKRKAK